MCVCTPPSSASEIGPEKKKNLRCGENIIYIYNLMDFYVEDVNYSNVPEFIARVTNIENVFYTAKNIIILH